jgi:hypothetical protein
MDSANGAFYLTDHQQAMWMPPFAESILAARAALHYRRPLSFTRAPSHAAAAAHDFL